nr:hypothetical protein [Tanacetum cinerariifolium]
EGPSAGSDRGSKRQKEGGEHASASTPSETATEGAGRYTTGSQSRQLSTSESALAEEPVQTTCQMEEPPHPVFKTGAGDQPIVQTSQHPECLTELEYHLEEVYKATTDQLDWVNPEGQQYPHNLLQPLPLIPDNQGRRVIPFDHFINNDLEYLRGDYNRHALWGVSHWGRKRQQFYGYAVNRESALDVYSKRRIIAVTELKIVKWYDYKHLDWISVRRDDDQIYKFKEGDFKRLRLQDIEDMLLLLPDRYRTDLRRREAYTVYSNIRGFIYQNKDKKNRLMRIDELHKFNDGTLNDVHNALDDRLKGIQVQYLPTTIWRRGDKDRAAAMIQVIERMLKTRRIMRSLEKFVGDKAILDTYGDSTILKRRREDDDQEGPSAGSNRGSKRQKEGGEQASASTPSETATEGAGRSTTGSQPRQMSASESAFVEEPVQTTCQIEEPPHLVFETGADDQPIIQTSQHPEWFSQPRKPPLPDRAWNTTLPAAQRDAQSWISDLASAIREHMSDSKWSRPSGLELARENLQYRVKEEDLSIDVKNTVFDLGVMKPLSFLLVDERVFIGLITKFIELKFFMIIRSLNVKVCMLQGPVGFVLKLNR